MSFFTLNVNYYYVNDNKMLINGVIDMQHKFVLYLYKIINGTFMCIINLYSSWKNSLPYKLTYQLQKLLVEKVSINRKVNNYDMFKSCG